jgi:hypothetical protein
MNKIILLAVFAFIASAASAQKYMTKTGKISFFSKTKIEDISAINTSISSIIDASTGDMKFVGLMKSFKFPKPLMEEHFNENYVESDKFPKTTFVGKITNLSDVNFSKDGKYPVQVAGILEIHGVKKNVESKGTLTVKGNTLLADTKFSILLSDYNIIIPTAVKKTINNSIEITVDVDYSKAP